MERTISVNYRVLRKNKGVLLNMFENTTVERYNIVHQYRKQERIDIEYTESIQ